MTTRRQARVPRAASLATALLLALAAAFVFAARPAMAEATLYVNAAWAGTTAGADPDGTGPATSFGTDAFATIQAAVTAAAPGDTIEVAAGAYVENVSVATAGLTIRGAGVGATNLTSGATGQAGETHTALFVQASNVTIEQLTLIGTGAVQNRGIVLGANLQLTVNDVEATGFVTGLYLNPGATAAITRNHAHGNTVGIGSDAVTAVTVTDSTFDGNTAEAIGASGALGSFTIRSSGFLGTKDVVVRYGDGNALDATRNWWGSSAGPASLTGVNATAWCTNAECTTFANYVVGPGMTVQDAIAAAEAGDTIELPAGTYTTGALVIDKNLTVIGSAGANPVLSPGAAMGTAGWIHVNAGVTFTIRDVVLDGNGASILFAIRSHGTTHVDGVDFLDIRSGTYGGVAVASFGGIVSGGGGSDSHGGAGGVASVLTVADSTFAEIGRIGVLVKGTQSTATITGNNYSGKGEGDFLDYAFEVGAGAAATISGNHIAANRGVAASDGSTSAGILVTTFFGAGSAATITGNTFSANSVGIHVGYDEADTSAVSAHLNAFLGDGAGIVTTAPTVDATSNWWGSPTGPAPIAGINATPWCTNAACTTLSNDPVLHALTVTTAGNGSVSPSGTSSHVAGSVVVLTATPGGGSTFAGWSGAGCVTGTVTMSVARSCVATFNAAAPAEDVGVASPPPVPVSTPAPAPTAIPTPTLTPTLAAGGAQPTLTLENMVTTPSSPTETTTTETTGTRGNVMVSVPAAALPANTEVTVGAIDNLASLVAQVPAPAGVQVALGFEVSASTLEGSDVTTDFAQPVTLDFTVNADVLPAGATAGELVVAFWNGTAWVEVATTVTLNADGSFTLSATTDHFTVFVVLRTLFRGTFDRVATHRGVNAALWRGGTVAQLFEQAPAAKSVWVFRDGRPYGYLAGAPAFANAAFGAQYPSGIVPAGTIAFIVLP